MQYDELKGKSGLGLRYTELILDVKNSTSFRTLHLLSHQKVYQAENSTSIIYIIGRPRPYGQDYPASKNMQWLLEHTYTDASSFVSTIAGYFLLILINKTDGSIEVINDHVGSIPCYVDQRDSKVLRISDSLAALQPSVNNTSINPQAAFNYIFYHCIPSPICLYRGICKLEPGVIVSFDNAGTLQQYNYYQPDFSPSNDTPEQLMQRCRQLISEAVRRNITDHCAAFLSGGLDSSTVAGMLAKHSQLALTYSIGFDAKGYDETEYALITAKHFGTTHKVHYLQPEEIQQHFAEVAGYFNEPFGNSSAMAAYMCAKTAKTDGIKVLLAGDGGDEIFAGNERYVKQKVFEHYSALPSPLQALLNLGLNNGLADKIPFLKKGSSYIRQAKVPLPDRLDSYNFVNHFDITQMFSAEFLQQIDVNYPAEQKRRRYHACPSADVVDKMMYLDWKFTLADNDLVKVSQMCQLAGVEVRFPLFEKELVDFSCSVPASLKAPGQSLRDFYKHSFRGFLPDATLTKSKHGFGLPFGVWLKQNPELKQLALTALQQFKERNILQPNFIDQAIDTFENGHSGYYGELVWIIVVLELWLQKNAE
ncbi:asparagine synthetase B family protein [Alishewanella jeotgali]|nr:asparagine synthase-related protein [Alishewanella jeotgali]